MVKLQACEPTHVVTEQKYEQGKRGGADVRRKAEKCHFMPSDHFTARSPGGPGGPIRLLQDSIGLQMGPVWQEAAFCCHH